MMDRLPGLGAFGEEPPPPPKLDERGVVAMDITEQFVTAAKSMFLPFKLLSGLFVKESRVDFYTCLGAI